MQHWTYYFTNKTTICLSISLDWVDSNCLLFWAASSFQSIAYAHAFDRWVGWLGESYCLLSCQVGLISIGIYIYIWILSAHAAFIRTPWLVRWSQLAFKYKQPASRAFILMLTHISCFINSDAAIKYATVRRWGSKKIYIYKKKKRKLQCVPAQLSSSFCS